MLAPTLTRRGLGPVEIYTALATVEAACRRHGLQYVIPTLGAIRDVWLHHPGGRLPYPSQELLAEMTGRSSRTIRRHLKALEDAGLLRVFRNRVHRVAGRWTRRTNRYLPLSGAARAMNRQNRRSRLGDTPDPLLIKRGPEKAPPQSFDAPEATGPPIDRAQVALLRASLARR